MLECSHREPAKTVTPEQRATFGDAFIVYSSEREAGHNGCGVELFAEWFSVVGPTRVSKCYGLDKFDPQFRLPEYQLSELWIAYSGMSGDDSEIWVTGGLFDGASALVPEPEQIADGPGFGVHPTWAPVDGGGTQTPSQPAGNFPITYTRYAPENHFVGALWQVDIGDYQILKTNRDLLSPEWYAGGEALLFIKLGRPGAVLAWWDGEGIEEVTQPDRFFVTGAGFGRWSAGPVG